MFTGHLQDARESSSSRGSYRQTRLDCLQQPVAICEGCAVSRAAHTVPSGSAAAHRSRWSSDGSAPAAQSTEQPLGLTPCTGVCPGSLSPCWEACPSDSSVSPLEPPYLTVHPFARSHVEGEIPPRSQTAASTDAPEAAELWGFIPTAPLNPPQELPPHKLPHSRREQPCSSHGDAPMKVTALPEKPLWHGLSRVLAAGACWPPLPSPIVSVCRPAASRSGSGRPWESTLIGRQTSLNINGLAVMFIAVTRGGTGLPPTFGKEALGGEGRAGHTPTVPASREGWAPWSRGRPYPSREQGGMPSLTF